MIVRKDLDELTDPKHVASENPRRVEMVGMKKATMTRKKRKSTKKRMRRSRMLLRLIRKLIKIRVREVP